MLRHRRSQSGANDGNRKERSDGIARQRKFAAASQKSLNEQERERETSKRAKRKPKPKKGFGFVETKAQSKWSE